MNYLQTLFKKNNFSDDIEFIDYELSNGLKVVLSEDHSIPSVAIDICYHAGSKNEAPDKRGYAHLFEHLMFEGSKHFPPGEYDKISLYAGGENNAYTTEDKTNYYLLLPSHQIELGLWLESDRLLEFSINNKSLKIQKNVVIEEKKQNYDNRPYGSVSIELVENLFKTSSYGWDTIGNIHDIQRANLKDVKEFYNKYYVPNNAVLSIVGDFDIKETSELISKYFGEIKKGSEVTEYSFNESPLTDEFRKIIFDEVQVPGIFIGYRMPKEFTKESFSLEILSEILSGGESSRFYKEIVYDKQFASEAGCYADSKEFTGIFYIYCIVMPGTDIDAVIINIDDIINDIRNGNIKQKEIEKAKNKIETRLAYRKQSILYKADLLAHLKCIYDRPEYINNLLERYISITSEDVLAAAKEYLTTNNRVVLKYLPKIKKKRYAKH